MTTLEYAKVCQQIIEQGLYKTELYHVFSPSPVDKQELLQFISDRFALKLNICAFQTQNSCDRTLSSSKYLIERLKISSISNQIKEL